MFHQSNEKNEDLEVNSNTEKVEPEKNKPSKKQRHSKSHQENENEFIIVQHCSGEGVKKYYKKQFCVYCGRDLTKLLPHLFCVHGTEKDVMKLSQMEKKSKECKTFCTKLQNEGNFAHNISVLKKGSGTLIVARRPTTEKIVSYKSYLPCVTCLGFFYYMDLPRHVKMHKNQLVKKAVSAGREVLASLSQHPSPQLLTLLSQMRQEDIANSVRNDWLIMKYGESLCEKYKLQNGQENLIREKLREMARILNKLREKNDLDQHQQLAKFLTPECFDEIITAVHDLTGKGNNIKTPSLALKIGHGLKKCSRILLGESLRKRDAELKAQSQEFLELMDNEWSEKVSKHALETLSNKKFNQSMDIPVTEDLVHLVTKIRQEMTALFEKKYSISQSDYRRLSELTLARLILFNKRRSGEASRVKISSFQNAKKMKCLNDGNKELLGSLTDLERRLAKQLLLIEIKGKRGRKVPLLVPNDAQNAISVILSHRSEANVPEENTFIFALPGSTSSLRGWDVLNKLAREFGCKKPESITGTNLRKYLSTTVQVIFQTIIQLCIVNWLAFVSLTHSGIFFLQKCQFEVFKCVF